MKRLLGLIGLVYLSVLAIVFYFYSNVVLFTVIGCSILSVILSLFFKVIKNKYKFPNILLTVGLTSFCAVMSIILYSNIIYYPTVNNYSEKEIKINGYICEEPQKNETNCTYILLADKIDEGNSNVKINLVSYSDLGVDEFDRVEGTVKANATDSNYLHSKGIYLSAYDGEFEIEKTGETQFSFYSYAVNARKALKSSIDSLLSPTPASVCKAILLGDKQSLAPDLKESFSNTGTSYMVVVSGMHLAIATGFILFLLRSFRHKRVLCTIAVISTVFAYCAVTGFSSSVVRAGVMVSLTHLAGIWFRRSDSLNSLGIASLVLTVFNPFAVGDVGMLLSFSATAGIILWSPPIYGYICEKIKLKRKIPKTIAKMFSVSLSASLWIVPIAVFAFGRISPLVVILSILCEYPVSLILIFALTASVIYLCPVVGVLAYPLAFVAGVLSKFVVWIISSFAKIPFCSVNAEKPYFYIWIALSVIFAVVGYLIKASRFYIKICTALSLCALLVGWAVFSIISYGTTDLALYYSGGGIVATVENGYNISVLSCGGAYSCLDDIIDVLTKNFSSVDNIIIPSQKNKFSKFLPSFLMEFDASNIMVYDNNSETQEMLENYDGNKRITFGTNTSFVLELCSGVNDTVYSINSGAVQYINANMVSVLLLPSNCDVSLLPEEIRTADYVVCETLPKNYELIDCSTVVFCGTEKQFEKSEEKLCNFADNVITLYNKNENKIFKVKLSEG